MKKKFLKVVIIMIMLAITYTTIVNALSFTPTIEPNSNTIAESTEFTVTVKVSNLDVGQNGINSLSGYFKYDKSVFETISEASVEGINGWNCTYSSDVQKITAIKSTFTKTEETVFTVVLKTKEKVSGKSGVIQFTNILASNSETEISAPDISTTIVVGTAGGNIANTSNTTSNTNGIQASTNRTNNTSINVQTNTRATNNATRNTNNAVPSFVNSTNKTDDDIPYTGIEDNLAFLIMGVAILAIVFYIKIERINKEMK